MPIFKLTAEVAHEWVEAIHYVNAETAEDAIRIAEAISDCPYEFHRWEGWQNSKSTIHTWDLEPMCDEDMLCEFEEMDDETKQKVIVDINYTGEIPLDND